MQHLQHVACNTRRPPGGGRGCLVNVDLPPRIAPALKSARAVSSQSAVYSDVAVVDLRRGGLAMGARRGAVGNPPEEGVAIWHGRCPLSLLHGHLPSRHGPDPPAHAQALDHRPSAATFALIGGLSARKRA